MLQGISWHEYIIFCGVVLFGYYLVVLIINRKIAFQIIKAQVSRLAGYMSSSGQAKEESARTESRNGDTQLSLFGAEDNPGFVQKPNSNHDMVDKDIQFSVVHEVVDEIENLFQSEYRSAQRQDIKVALKILLKKYAVLQGSFFQEGINKLIVDSCRNNCSIHLSAQEVTELWI